MGNSRNLELLQGGSPTAFPIIAIRRADDSVKLIQTRSRGRYADKQAARSLKGGREWVNRETPIGTLRSLPRFSYVPFRVGKRTDRRDHTDLYLAAKARTPGFQARWSCRTTAGRALAAAWPVGRCNVVEMLAAKLRDPE